MFHYICTANSPRTSQSTIVLRGLSTIVLRGLSSIVLRGLRGPLIGPPWCRETPASRTASVNFSSSFKPPKLETGKNSIQKTANKCIQKTAPRHNGAQCSTTNNPLKMLVETSHKNSFSYFYVLNPFLKLTRPDHDALWRRTV